MTDPIAPFISKEMIIADRKRRGIKSRTAYKALTGLGESAQVRWEEDDPARRKPGEYEKLAPFIFDTELGTPATTPSQSSTDAAPVADTTTSGEVPDSAGSQSAPTAATSTVDSGSSSVEPPAFATLSVIENIDRIPDGQPIELFSGEDLDDPEVLGNEVVIPGSGLPSKVEYQIPGYHITNSELSTFKRCKRKWYLAYYRELKLIRPDLTGARSIGTRLHLALQAHYSTRQDDPYIVLQHTVLEDRLLLEERGDQQGLEDLAKDAELCKIMLEGYFEWIEEEGKDSGIEVLSDEEIVEAPFMTAEQANWVQDVVLMGKMDLRVRRIADGRRLFVDHKSVGSLKEPLKTLHMNEQMLHYHLLEFLSLLKASSEGAAVEHAGGGLYNMLRKVKRTARANPPFYDRVEVPHNEHEIRSYYIRVWGEVLDIIELRKKLDAGTDHRMVAYPTPTGNCSWDCDFIAVCPLFDDGSAAEDMLGALYESGNPHDYYAPFGEFAADQQEGK